MNDTSDNEQISSLPKTCLRKNGSFIVLMPKRLSNISCKKQGLHGPQSSPRSLCTMGPKALIYDCNLTKFTYHKVANSRPVYYSILNHFWGAINWDVLLNETCYYCRVQQSNDKRVFLMKSKRFALKQACALKQAYSRVWNKRSPLNKRSPWNSAKRISVAPFIPYTYTTKIGSMESGIRP